MPNKNKISGNKEPKPFIPEMIESIKKTFRGDPHSLSEVKDSLDEDAEALDFIYVLERHHDFLQESIDVLLDKGAKPLDKQLHLSRFLHLVQMHGKAEEETLYIALKDNSEKVARVEGFAGQDEHDVAYQLGSELYQMNFEQNWSEEIDAKAKVLAGLVANHIKEEESEMFPLAQKILSTELETLTSDYIEKCKVYLDVEMRIDRTSPLASPTLRDL